MNSIIQNTEKVLSEYSLCPNCVGRQFALLISGLTNKQRGESLLATIALQIHQQFLLTNTYPESIKSLLTVKFKPFDSLLEKLKIKDESIQKFPCYICLGILNDSNLHELAEKIFHYEKTYEFSTFLIGCTVPAVIAEKEELIRTKFDLKFGEPFKSEFNRELGKIVGKKLPHKEVEFKNPEILFVVDLETNFISVKSNPLFLEGRYRKLVRGIPQSIWHCNKCRGKGCEECDYSGRLYADSVEEYITPYIMTEAKGIDTKLHCAGREDIDALMLGSGRPFVVEISQPKKRSLNLAKLEVKINTASNRRVEVTLSGISNRNTVRELKSESSTVRKRYRLGIKLVNDVEWNENQIKQSLIGKIEQKTPNRVLHRRVDTIRTKHVYDVTVNIISPSEAEIEVYCQGGLYVKELIHGDSGRTIPNLAQILNTGIEIRYLDVLHVEN